MKRSHGGRVRPGAGEIVAALREVAFREGERVSIKKFTRLTGIAESDIYRWFDSWGDVRVEAGLSRRVPYPRWYADDDILAELHRVVKLLGRLPNVKEFNRHSRISAQRLYHRFGSLPETFDRYRQWLREQAQQATQREPAEPVGPVRNPTPLWEDEDRLRELQWLRNRWCSMRVGLEVRSSDYADLPADACDLLVVLKHDWPACPVPVIEFCTLMGDRRVTE